MLYITGILESAMLTEQRVCQHFGGVLELNRFFALPCADSRVVFTFSFMKEREYDDLDYALMELDAIEHGLRLIAGENYYAMMDLSALRLLGIGRKEISSRLAGIASSGPAEGQDPSVRHRLGVQGDAAVIKELLGAKERNTVDAIFIEPGTDTITAVMSSPLLGQNASPYTIEALHEGTKIVGHVYPSGARVRLSGLSAALDAAYERHISVARLIAGA